MTCCLTPHKTSKANLGNTCQHYKTSHHTTCNYTRKYMYMYSHSLYVHVLDAVMHELIHVHVWVQYLYMYIAGNVH